MSKLSLREAAKLAGRGKTTIHAAINDGRLTAERNEAGGYEIDPAELHRVFPLKVDPDTGQFIDQRTPKDSQDSDEAERPSLSLALSRTATRTGRAGGALATAEHERLEVAHCVGDRLTDGRDGVGAAGGRQARSGLRCSRLRSASTPPQMLEDFRQPNAHEALRPRPN